MPPEQQKVVQMPPLCSQVPDLTIFSPSNKLPLNNNRTNFLQRSMAGDKILNIPKQQPMKNLHGPMTNKHIFNTQVPMKPSVPDLSLFEPKVLNPTSRPNLKKSTNMIFTKPPPKLTENIFDAIGVPSVPDVTILDEEPKQMKPKDNSDPKVFSESYQKVLITTHEEFMKQIKEEDQELNHQANPTKKRAGFFHQQPAKYQSNPLRKYAPKPPPITHHELDTSSILVEFDEIEPPPRDNEDQADERTFKKVAAMLNEMKKLVTPENGTSDNSQEELEKKPMKLEILRSLAQAFLTQDELKEFDVEDELDEMEIELG